MKLIWPEFSVKGSQSKEVGTVEQKAILNEKEEKESVLWEENILVLENEERGFSPCFKMTKPAESSENLPETNAHVHSDTIYNKLYKSNIKKLVDLYR